MRLTLEVYWRSASSSTRCSTPLVSFLRQTGQILPNLMASCGEKEILQSRARPMVFAVGWVGFDCKLESCWVIFDYGVCDLLVAEFFEFKHVGFSADAPWPETVAVTVRNQCVLVEFAKAPVHGWVR